MQINRPILFFIYATVMTITLPAAFAGCAGNQMEYKMNENDRLAACPDRPNCVSSEAQDPRRAVAPMQLAGDPAIAWAEIQAKVKRFPRSTIVKATDRYLHVILKSRVFGFIDDLELRLDPQTKRIAIRSASRSGYFDLGVNRRRVENLRKQLKAAALIR